VTDALLARLDPRDYPEVARLVLPAPTAAWVDSGLAPPADNEAAFGRYRLLPRSLVDVGGLSLAASLLGRPVSMPVGIAPVAVARVLHPDGEIAMARAAARAGVVHVLAVNASTPVSEVAAAAPDAELWLQVANWTDRDALAAVVAEAQGAGVRAIVPLVNSPVAVAHVPAQVGFRLPDGVTFAHGAAGQTFDPAADAAYLRWLVDMTNLPVVAKGVLRPDDARRVVDAGAAGLIVSNHGGRQLPRSVATIDALEGVARAVGGDAEVYLDGGVRSGSDVLVALALGARAVFVGRPAAWGLAVGGEEGVTRVLGRIRADLEADAALCGVTDLGSVPRDLVATAVA
jgi:isopentenyl diphosphate isomerase/L-lactate dehydrogenase-like FMN-dependent dehydrogenase